MDVFKLEYENENFCGIKFGYISLIDRNDCYVRFDGLLDLLFNNEQECQNFLILDDYKELFVQAMRSKKTIVNFLLWSRSIPKYELYSTFGSKDFCELTLPQECFGKYVVNDTTILYLNNLIYDLNSDWSDILEEYKRLYEFKIKSIDKLIKEMKDSNIVHKIN